jgi:hypothetical protein
MVNGRRPAKEPRIGARRRAAARGRDSRLPDLYGLAPDLFRENRAYVTIDQIDDVASILRLGTEDHLMIGTDYSHTEFSANLSALAGVREWAAGGRVSAEQAENILVRNPRTFYGL